MASGIVNGGLSGMSGVDVPKPEAEPAVAPLPNSGLSGVSSAVPATTPAKTILPANGGFSPMPSAAGTKYTPEQTEAIRKAIAIPGSDYSKLLPLFGNSNEALRQATQDHSVDGQYYDPTANSKYYQDSVLAAQGKNPVTDAQAQGRTPILTAPPATSGIVGTGLGGSAVNTFGNLPAFDPNDPFKNTPATVGGTPGGGISTYPSPIPAPGTPGSITEKPPVNSVNTAAFNFDQFNSQATPTTTTTPTPTAPVASGPAPTDPGSFASIAANENPVLRTVQSPETVQGQLGNILTTGNPLLEAAKARAMKQAASRGLVNSSIASQAGEEAMVNTALPIAQQDAATYNNVAQANQDVQNLFIRDKYATASDMLKQYEAYKQNNAMFDKDAALKRYLSDSTISSEEKRTAMNNAASVIQSKISAAASGYASKLQADTSLQNAQTAAESQRYSTNVGAATQEDVSKLNAATQLSTAGINANSQQAIAAMSSATQKYIQDANAKATLDLNLMSVGNAARTNFGQQLTAILTNQNSTPEATQNAIANLTAFYAGNPVPGLDIDFGGKKTVPSTTPAVTTQPGTNASGVVNSATSGGIGSFGSFTNPNQP